jgi:hypothetical protein
MGKFRRKPKTSKGLEKELAAAKKAKRLLPNVGAAPWMPVARDLEIYGRYCEGAGTMRELSGEYGIDHSTICQIIKKVEQYLAAKYSMEIREFRVRTTERLELIFARAMQSYGRSCEDAITITTTCGGDSGDITRQEIARQAGSAALLGQAREALAEIANLWGANAPKETKVTINSAVRVGGRTPEQALQARLDHLIALKSSAN